MIAIDVGQTWKDKDKRREQDGNVRTFVVQDVSSNLHVACRELSTKKLYYLNRTRFGSGRKNDSLELVSEKEANA